MHLCCSDLKLYKGNDGFNYYKIGSRLFVSHLGPPEPLPADCGFVGWEGDPVKLL